MNLHQVENYLLRLNSIMALMTDEGKDFVTEEVKKDALEALDFIKKEFEAMEEGKIYEKIH